MKGRGENKKEIEYYNEMKKERASST